MDHMVLPESRGYLSPYFQVLHEERGPTGHLGRGTHYSVLRAVVFQDGFKKPLRPAQWLDFAVIWDEDHDTRIMRMVEKLYAHGLLQMLIICGERKGGFCGILSDELRGMIETKICEELFQEIAQSSDNDPWNAQISYIDSEYHSIIQDADEKVRLYLNNLKMLWGLGLKPITHTF